MLPSPFGDMSRGFVVAQLATQVPEALAPSSRSIDGRKPLLMQILHDRQPIAYPAGQFIQVEQEPVDRLLLVVEGLAKVRSFQHNGCEEVLHVLGPGDCIGLSCLFDSCSAWGDVVALTDVKVLRVACDEVRAMLDHDARLAYCCLQMLHDHLLDLKRRVLERRLSATERLLWVLRELAWKAAPIDGKQGVRFVPALPQAELAALAGLARETVSRTLSTLQNNRAVTKVSKGWLLAEPVA